MVSFFFISCSSPCHLPLFSDLDDWGVGEKQSRSKTQSRNGQYQKVYSIVHLCSFVYVCKTTKPMLQHT